MNFETLSVSSSGHIATISLNRPDKANAMNLAMWHELRQASQWLDATPTVRVIILSGEGKHFTSGIDLELMAGLMQRIKNDCPGRTRENLRTLILDLQDTLSSLERCRKPILAAIHGACIGGGIDLIACTDMRYCSADAHFAIKEIDIGMTADVGTLQRLPKLIGIGQVRELAYTGRRLGSEEAVRIGLVNQVFADRAALLAGVHELAEQIAAKSPLAIRGTKEMLNYARDHTVADGLNYIATWNAAMLLSNDLDAAMHASQTRQAATFAD